MRLNRFIKGIVSDIDYNYVTNEQWVFPTENMRIIQDGQSYRLCNVMGNEEVTLVQFSGDIKPLGYVPISIAPPAELMIKMMSL